jgi:PKD repeat protein
MVGYQGQRTALFILIISLLTVSFWLTGTQAPSFLRNPTLSSTNLTRAGSTLPLSVDLQGLASAPILIDNSQFSSPALATDIPPIAKFTESTSSTTTGQAISFDAGQSTDPDGTITSFDWNFGDGTTGTGITTTHSYNAPSAAGGYTVTLTVTDNSGNTAMASAVKMITSQVNVPPVAKFTESTTMVLTGVSISFDASTSNDPDGGSIVSYAWDFGDGTIGAGVTITHSYGRASPLAGYTVTLTVTDGDGGDTGTATATKTIQDRPPMATFTESTSMTTTGTSITFDASESADPDGTITSYSWNFGDGTTATGVTTSHTYSSPSPTGGYTVTLTVTDNSASTRQTTAIKTITAPANVPPTVSFTEDKTTANTGDKITLTITASDMDDTVASITVDWGDGTPIDTLPGTATTDGHSYASTGNAKSQTFTVVVTATDSRGAASAPVQAIKTINDQPPTVTFTEDHTTVDTGQTITLASTSSDVDGTIAQTIVNWGDGTIDTLPGSATTESHAYPSTGNSKTATYLVYVNVTDNSGTTTKSAVTTKTVSDRPPVAAFTFTPTSPVTAQGVSFNASTSTDPDGTISSYAWTFGDGSTGTGATPSHVYNTPGTFQATLTVTDNSGSTGTATNNVIVANHVAAVTLSFQTHDCDDYEHGVGQLDVLANGNLVVNIPAGLFHLAGSGDYAPYTDAWVQLGPFNIATLQGQNTLVFRNPLDSHECDVKDVVVTSGQTTLLNYTKTIEVEPEEPIRLTFSNPPLVLTSFTDTSKTVANREAFTFNATFTGGTGPFTCTFQFGDQNSKTVTTTSHTCTTTHTFRETGTFTVTVKVRGASTSDRATGTLQIQPEHKPHPVEDKDDDVAPEQAHHHHETHHHRDWD